MNLTLHRLMAAAGVVLVLIGLLAVRLSVLGLDFWNAPKLQAQLQSEEQLDRTLDSKSEVVSQRTAMKEAIVRELAEGTLDLVQAAARFSRLHESQGNFMSLLHARYPGLTGEECICRNTIEFASSRIEDRSDGQAIMARLERQFRLFQASLRHPGA
jgi:cell division protein FtsB